MCKIEGCDNKSRGALGYCQKHYLRLKKYGDPLKSIKGHEPLEMRFWKFVDKRGEDECWSWKGQILNGYGRISIGARDLFSDGAHRVSWMIHNSQTIPTGMVVMHSCDNPGCVNPKHLSIGTYKDNHDDMVAKGRKKQVIPVGEENGKAVLTEELVREIRTSSLNNADMARKLGVSPNCIRGVRIFRTWKHVKNTVK